MHILQFPFYVQVTVGNMHVNKETHAGVPARVDILHARIRLLEDANGVPIDILINAFVN